MRRFPPLASHTDLQFADKLSLGPRLALADAFAYLIVRDPYPTFGWDGYHLQPAEAIANALRRDDGAEGGVLLFVAAKNKVEIEEEARARARETRGTCLNIGHFHQIF